ncbi:hypothetical protein PPSIR1_12168 [Plesiocystis pacifica SIR-1]|uniref:Uncharacterized protein n=2 Tax=Plesiocystis pacifica TaxID=191768 RepID=A6G5W3_9BACT|nr:hypothetical protein PPSIR1_12168 [Plesiocystis pacifica SIR-1]
MIRLRASFVDVSTATTRNRMTMKRTITPLLGLGAVMLAVSFVPGTATGADHTDSPSASADPAADISDFYAWHDGGGNLVLALNFAGLTGAGGSATYDGELLYGIHVDRDEDGVSDHDFWVRFGQNGGGDWGVQVIGLPGEEAFSGPVEEVLTSPGGSMVYAGLREDPFFFDFDGFLATLDTGTVMFNPMNDSFAGTNVTSIVIETDALAVGDGSSVIDIWATSSRL